jgi:hypothetical protein
MYLRQSLNTTLGDLDTLLAERTDNAEVLRVEPKDVKFHLDATDATIALGEREVPATPEALQAFGDVFQIPAPFLKRAVDQVSKDTINAVFNDMVQTSLHKDVRVALNGEHLADIGEWGRDPINARQVVQAATNVLGADAEVVRLIDQPGTFFGFDARVADDAEVGIYGDGSVTAHDGNRVNDVTAGGLRLSLDLKRGLAPSVTEYMHRLVCTNGMTTIDEGLKIDARGQTVDEVIADLERAAQIAFSRVEASAAAFYDLREQRVSNVEQAIRQIARERGVPDRSTLALIDLAATTDMPDEPTMFDVVNLFTNLANRPGLRDGGRLILEAAGGAVIAENAARQHAARCGHCEQKVTR